MQAGQVTVSVARMLSLYDHAFLKNNATPSTLITTPPFAEEDERQAFREQFMAEYGGFQNAGKTAFAEVEDADNPGAGAGNSMVNVQRIGSTAVEGELRQLAEDCKDDICLMWGVPRSVLGDSSGKTFANSGQDRRNYWIETLKPKASEFADLMNTVISPELGRDFGWFDLAQVPELQSESLITGVNVVALVANNVISRDEARASMGLPPADDVGLPPFGVTPGTGRRRRAQSLRPLAKTVVDPGAVPPPARLRRPPPHRWRSRPSPWLAAASPCWTLPVSAGRPGTPVRPVTTTCPVATSPTRPSATR